MECIIFFQKVWIRPSYVLRRSIHSQYLVTNESNGTREITLNHEKTKFVPFLIISLTFSYLIPNMT